MPQLKVRIHNPKPGTKFTSLKSAQRYVKRGLARWIEMNAVVEFIDSTNDYRACAVEDSRERAMQIGYDREANNGLLAPLDAIKHLPVAGDPSKCYTVVRNGPPAIRPFRRLAPMRVLVSSGQPVSA